MEIISGFVTKCSKYKDNDAILNIINESGEDALIIRGAYTKNSKYLKYAKTFYVANFETYRGNYAHKKLREVEVVEDYNLLFDSFDKIVYLQLIQEFFSKIYNKEDSSIFYKLLTTSLNRIKETRKYDTYTFMFVSYALKISGYGINTSDLMIDKNNSINLNALSIQEGKLVFIESSNEGVVLLNHDEVLLINDVFNHKYLITERNLKDKNIDYIKLIKAISDVYTFYSDNRIISTSLL